MSLRVIGSNTMYAPHQKENKNYHLSRKVHIKPNTPIQYTKIIVVTLTTVHQINAAKEKREDQRMDSSI